MSDKPDLSHYPLAQIAATCAEQMQRFSLGQSTNPHACHELLRRAFDEQQPDACDHVFILLAPRLRNWLHRHSNKTPDMIEDVIQETFAQLMNDSQHGVFVVAPYALPQVLQFIKRRTLIVLKELTSQERYPHGEPDQVTDESRDDLSDLDAVIATVQTLLNEDEWHPLAQHYLHTEVVDALTARRLKLAALHILLRRHLTPEEFDLFWLRHVVRMKPAAIARTYHVDIKALSLRLASLMRRIRNKPDLRKLFGISDEP